MGKPRLPMKNDCWAIDRPDGTTVYRATRCGAEAEEARGGTKRNLTPEEIELREHPPQPPLPEWLARSRHDPD